MTGNFRLDGVHIEVVREAEKYAQLAAEDALECERILEMVQKLIEENNDIDEESLVAVLVASYSYEIGIREGFKQAKQLYGIKDQ